MRHCLSIHISAQRMHSALHPYGEASILLDLIFVSCPDLSFQLLYLKQNIQYLVRIIHAHDLRTSNTHTSACRIEMLMIMLQVFGCNRDGASVNSAQDVVVLSYPRDRSFVMLISAELLLLRRSSWYVACDARICVEGDRSATSVHGDFRVDSIRMRVRSICTCV